MVRDEERSLEELQFSRNYLDRNLTSLNAISRHKDFRNIVNEFVNLKMQDPTFLDNVLGNVPKGRETDNFPLK